MGAGGLSHQLATRFPQQVFVSVEHNPFLAVCADRIMRGKSLKLFDYSAYPNALENSARKWEISGDTTAGANHRTLLCSFPELPFAEQVFDVIVVPWFLDVLELPFRDAMAHATRFLRPGGRMLFVGPANVHSPDELKQYCPEEIIALFEAGFEHVDHHQQNVRYLNSPLDSQNREESVLFVCATGVRAGVRAAGELPDPGIRYTAELEHYKLELQTMSAILQFVDRDMSHEELAAVLVQRFGFELAESLHYAKTVIRSVEQQASRNR